MGKKANHNKVRNGLIAALDIGTTKVCCLIARVGEAKGIQVVGIGHQISGGLRSGNIVDMVEAEAAIRNTVEAAEQMAGENISDVILTVSAGKPRSRLIAFEISIAGHRVTEADLNKLLTPADVLEEHSQGRDLIHAIPVGYSIDGNRGVHDPRGMCGDRLGVNMHLVSVEQGPLKNLTTCVKHCHLGIASQVVAPYASAQACLVEDERQLGVTVIDMGGGTTSIAVFFDNELIHTDSIPVGGGHVTNDIARGLSTPIAQAERMKTLYGSTIASPSDDREIIQVPLIGEASSETTQVTRSMLVGIIRPRIEETFELVQKRLKDRGIDKVCGRNVVLTGGASQLTGVPELASQILGKQVRIGRPQGVRGLAEAVSGPAFSTAAGLLLHAVNNPAEVCDSTVRPIEEPSSRLGRLGQWLRENF